ncbi:2-phospho-L-lactate guanylyltransferase [Nocardia otitidiscaviarum]|uniref:2-phospho-L-lactate guanylyltransferase n=1 Tax=Nocardia otitidiscaviarum TaxID=1823 RepID=UPI001892F26B|nr:2-phospho-L-lactate guanylyltransferase [Nocardia otitidiscaviarum]MBF6182683.1 2-phospho-L-lactate guanylyltransferase [Nocardia otitidiscaviarum]
MRSSVHAVIAVKSLALAKSRLADRLHPRDRPRLVLAMLADTVDAATATPEIGSVTVVTPDPRVADLVRGLGAYVHPEAMRSQSRADSHSGLNAALSAAAEAVRHHHGPVELLALQADLPALRPVELSGMLTAAPEHRRAVVADHAGTGTVALLVRDGSAPLAPLFGTDSARRHIAAGAVELLGDWPGLRQDVDTADDLGRAMTLGVGVNTRALLSELGVSRRRDGKHSVDRTGPPVRRPA